jgi:hypothetical protein
MPKLKPEALIQRTILAWLRANGLHAQRVNAGQIWVGKSPHPWGPKGRPVHLAETGHSDLTVELPDGRTAYLEVKAPRGRVTAAQEAFLARQAARGCPAGVVRSIGDVQALLDAAGVVLRARVA